jgi:hypothetical protein
MKFHDRLSRKDGIRLVRELVSSFEDRGEDEYIFTDEHGNKTKCTMVRN